MKKDNQYNKPQIEKNKIPNGMTFPMFEAFRKFAMAFAFLFRKHEEFDKDEEVDES